MSWYRVVVARVQYPEASCPAPIVFQHVGSCRPVIEQILAGTTVTMWMHAYEEQSSKVNVMEDRSNKIIHAPPHRS